ncbi:DUF982 domain-containing protein, partial [Mesorhizobium sp. M1C.F.Ca.ET.193.01.1.1]
YHSGEDVRGHARRSFSSWMLRSNWSRNSNWSCLLVSGRKTIRTLPSSRCQPRLSSGVPAMRTFMRWFSPKVSVRTKKVGVRQVVSSVEVAAEHLLQWEKRGPKWRKAVEMCLAAIEGKG